MQGGRGKEPARGVCEACQAAPYPMMLLAYDWMLDDIVRFCTSASEFCVFGIDPTFSLGATKSPTMICSLFIHVKKDFAT